MKLLKLIPVLLILTITSGCSWQFWSIDKPVEVKPGQYTTIAKPVKARCWITNKETKRRELREVEAQAGWWIVNPKDRDR